MKNLPANLIDYAKAAFTKACQGWTIQYATPYKSKANKANSFLIVANGQVMESIPFEVSIDSKGWLVERI